MRSYTVSDHLKKVLRKLFKKDKSCYEALLKKIKEIVCCKNIEHYKNLRKPLQQLKRVHVKSSFVLVFEYNKSEDSISFYDFDHHDNIYKK